MQELDKYALSVSLNTKEAIQDTKRFIKQMNREMDKLNSSLSPVGGSRGSVASRSASAPTSASSGGLPFSPTVGGAIGFGAIGTAAGVLTLTNAIKGAADVSRKFETAQAKVKSALSATDEESRILSENAREIGKSTIFSALQVSEAQEVLARNGLDFETVMGGTVEASLNLAGAMSTDLAPAADLLTDVMAQFNLKASDSEDIINDLVGAKNNSKLGFDDLRLAIGNAGGAVASAGVEFEDLVSSLAIISPSFQSGATAGTAFRNLITDLSPKTKTAREEMERLGLSFFDAEGNLDSMEDVTKKLTQAFEGMSEEERKISLDKIFTTESGVAASALINSGAEGFRQINVEIDKADAKISALGQKGEIDREILLLNSAVEELGLTVSEAGINDALLLSIQSTKALTEGLTTLFSTDYGALIDDAGKSIGNAASELTESFSPSDNTLKENLFNAQSDIARIEEKIQRARERGIDPRNIEKFESRLEAARDREQIANKQFQQSIRIERIEINNPATQIELESALATGIANSTGALTDTGTN